MSSSIVKSAVQQLGSLLVEEAKYLHSVKRKIESLQMELEWIECFLKDADTRQLEDEVVRKWVSHVRDFAYEAEDTIETYLHEVRLHRGHGGIRNTLKWFSSILCTSDAWTLHNLGSKIDDLTIKMSELTSRWKRYGIKLTRPIRSLEYNTMIREKMVREERNREERRTYSHTEEYVVGLAADIEEVVYQLKKTDVKVVAISGLGWLGKTTLARKVLNHKDIKDHFNDNCAWAYISKEFDDMDIFQEILRQLEKGKEARKRIKGQLKVEELHGEISKLLQVKKCLVVVDDIWTVKAWERLKPAFESIRGSSSSSKILITTRNQDLLQHVDRGGYLHLLPPLTNDDSWELLKRKAFKGLGSTGGVSSTPGDIKISQNEPQAEVNYECMGRNMLQHCHGIPIAILALGGILSTRKNISEWEDAVKNISNYIMGGIEEGGEYGDQILQVYELSYHDLPLYLKPCFLYLGSFPENYRISTQQLYHLWKVEGFLVTENEAKMEGEKSYDIGERYLNELVQRSLVQVRECWTSGRMKTCQLNGVVRDMCLRKCKEEGFLEYIEYTGSYVASTLPPISNEIEKLRRCAVYDENGDLLDTLFQIGERAKCLRSLLVFHKIERGNLQKIRKAFPLLRVLDLKGTNIGSVNGVEHLVHLRYLNLKNSGVIELPSRIYDLTYLETLDLRCGYRKINLCDKFYKMKRLRHLYLPGNFKVEADKKLMFPIGGQMVTIQNFHPEKCETEELMQMTNLRVFSIRREYVFKKVEELKWVVEAPVMKKAGYLINTFPSIRIQENVIKESPWILNSVAGNPSFKVLSIEGTGEHVKGNSIIFPNSLTRVELKNCDTIVEDDLLLDLEKLPHLQVLHLDGSTIEEATNKMSFSPGSFSQLTEFRVKRPKRSFKWEVGKAAAPNLQLLELQKCENLNKLKNIPKSLTGVELRSCRITEGEVSALEKLPHLESLCINGEQVGIKLLSFSADSFPQLTELRLEGQTELEEWEVGEGALANLRSLKLEGWNKLKKVMNKLPDSLTQVELERCEIGEGGVSLLGCLEKLPRLQKLEINGLVRSGGGNKLSFSPGSFPQLTKLDIIWHPELMEWEVGDGALPNLQRLTLREWKKLNKLNYLPNSLTGVDLFHCEIGEAAARGALLLALENLPCLQQLKLWDCEIVGERGNKMSFSPGSFLPLTQLSILYPEELGKWEWEVGDGALPNLQYLELKRCSKLKKIPNRGLLASVHIECENPCVKGIEKYNTCPHFKKEGQVKRRWGRKARRWVQDSCG